MGLLHLLIAALAATAALSGDPCGCVNTDQKLDPISNPMIFLQQPTEGAKPNGVPCAMSCTLTAHAYDEANDGLAIQILSNDLKSATITVIDGPINHTITKNTEQKDISWKSTTGILIFNFDGDVSPAGVFMIVVQKSQRDPIPSQIPTTEAVPTSPYPKEYHGNPLLVANDIMIGVDLSSDDLSRFQSFAVDLVNALTITNATDCGAGTRLGLHGLTNYQGFSPTYFPDWQYLTDNAVGNIKAMSQIGNGPFYIEPVEGFINNGFKDDGCPNRGRIYILFTSQNPAEYKPLESDTGASTMADFIQRGVHPIVVSPSLTEDKSPYYDQYKTKDVYNRWSYFDIGKGVTEFFNTFLVDTVPALSCQQPSDFKITLTEGSINKTEKVAIPPYYEGMKDITGPPADWDTIKHYCNFQKTTVSIEQAKEQAKADDPKPSGKQDVCLKVFYDLETDKDFVSIYKNNPDGSKTQIVKLTGRDVSGSMFRLGSRSGSIEFSSDEKNVYDGFYAEITACGDTYTPPSSP